MDEVDSPRQVKVPQHLFLCLSRAGFFTVSAQLSHLFEVPRDYQEPLAGHEHQPEVRRLTGRIPCCLYMCGMYRVDVTTITPTLNITCPVSSSTLKLQLTEISTLLPGNHKVEITRNQIEPPTAAHRFEADRQVVV